MSGWEGSGGRGGGGGVGWWGDAAFGKLNIFEENVRWTNGTAKMWSLAVDWRRPLCRDSFIGVL